MPVAKKTSKAARDLLTKGDRMLKQGEIKNAIRCYEGAMACNMVYGVYCATAQKIKDLKKGLKKGE